MPLRSDARHGAWRQHQSEVDTGCPARCSEPRQYLTATRPRVARSALALPAHPCPPWPGPPARGPARAHVQGVGRASVPRARPDDATSREARACAGSVGPQARCAPARSGRHAHACARPRAGRRTHARSRRLTPMPASRTRGNARAPGRGGAGSARDMCWGRARSAREARAPRARAETPRRRGTGTAAASRRASRPRHLVPWPTACLPA